MKRVDLWKSIGRQLFADASPRATLLKGFEVLMYVNIALLSLYGATFGTYPKNAFLAALFGSFGLAILSMALRFQLAPHALKTFSQIPEHRAFVEYTVGSVFVLLAAFTFLG